MVLSSEEDCLVDMRRRVNITRLVSYFLYTVRAEKNVL